MGSHLPCVVVNILMKAFQRIVLESSDLKSKTMLFPKRKRYNPKTIKFDKNMLARFFPKFIINKELNSIALKFCVPQ